MSLQNLQAAGFGISTGVGLLGGKSASLAQDDFNRKSPYSDSINEASIEMPQVAQQGQQLSHALAAMERCVEMLHSRLVPILRPESPRPMGGEQDAAAPVLVPLAEHMRVEAQKAQRLAEILNSLIQRIEV